MNWKSPCLSCDWWLTGNAFIWLFFKGSFHLVIAIIMIDSSIKCNFYSWFLTLRLCVIARCSVTIFAFRSKLRNIFMYSLCSVYCKHLFSKLFMRIWKFGSRRQQEPVKVFLLFLYNVVGREILAGCGQLFHHQLWFLLPFCFVKVLTFLTSDKSCKTSCSYLNWVSLYIH